MKKLWAIIPANLPGEKLPVESVSWNDTVAFCDALTKKERVPNGWKFTLPTEAQWKYACIAGTTTEYSWGDEIDPKLANYKVSALERTVEVGSINQAHGAFSICTGMCGSGVLIGMTITPAVL